MQQLTEQQMMETITAHAERMFQENAHVFRASGLDPEDCAKAFMTACAILVMRMHDQWPRQTERLAQQLVNQFVWTCEVNNITGLKIEPREDHKTHSVLHESPGLKFNEKKH